MMKRYANLSVLYAVLGLAGGVFYREFTKLSGYTGVTMLSSIHTHYLTLGLFFFLLLLLLEKSFEFSGQKGVKTAVLLYNIGLNVSGAGFLMRGLTQVLATPMTRALDASISGVAGLGHMMLGIAMVWLLMKVRKKVD